MKTWRFCLIFDLNIRFVSITTRFRKEDAVLPEVGILSPPWGYLTFQIGDFWPSHQVKFPKKWGFSRIFVQVGISALNFLATLTISYFDPFDQSFRTSLKILEKRSRTLSAEKFFLLYSVKGTKISGDSVHERNSRILRAVDSGYLITSTFQAHKPAIIKPEINYITFFAAKLEVMKKVSRKILKWCQNFILDGSWDFTLIMMSKIQCLENYVIWLVIIHF